MEIKELLLLFTSMALLIFYQTKVQVLDEVKDKINYLSMMVLLGLIIIIGILIDIAYI